jgi:cysteinyl-tRNA synthetase
MDKNRSATRVRLIFILTMHFILPDFAGLLSAQIPSSVRHFTYQLQNLNLEALGRSGFDLVIMDYSADGSPEGEFTKEQIAGLKPDSSAGRTVLAYLSIGEAEDYRFYWRGEFRPGNPEWLEGENPDWAGNYKVRFWHADWQAVVLEYLDRILSAGFNGVYLDVVDAYEYFQEKGRSSAAQEMVDFIRLVRSHAHVSDPDFYVFIQNASELLRLNADVIQLIDGIGQEDLFFGYDGDGKATPQNVTSQWESNLLLAVQAGKTVLTIDYPFAENESIPRFNSATLEKISAAYRRSRGNGFIPYCTVRNLDYLTLNPGFDPTEVARKSRISGEGDGLSVRCHPNPFNENVTIGVGTFGLPGGGGVLRIRILDTRGRTVTVLHDGPPDGRPAAFSWNGCDAGHNRVPGGVYIISLETATTVLSAKIVLLK